MEARGEEHAPDDPRGVLPRRRGHTLAAPGGGAHVERGEDVQRREREARLAEVQPGTRPARHAGQSVSRGRESGREGAHRLPKPQTTSRGSGAPAGLFAEGAYRAGSHVSGSAYAVGSRSIPLPRASESEGGEGRGGGRAHRMSAMSVVPRLMRYPS